MTLSCPLCMGANFSSEEMLLYNLVCSATQSIVCPICSDVLRGFDKFTVHLCAHILKCDNGPVILKPDDNVTIINDRFKNMNVSSFAIPSGSIETDVRKEELPEPNRLNASDISANDFNCQPSPTGVHTKLFLPEISETNQLSDVVNHMSDAGTLTVSSSHRVGSMESSNVLSNTFLDTENYSNNGLAPERRDINKNADWSLPIPEEMTVDTFFKTLVANFVPSENGSNPLDTAVISSAEKNIESQIQPNETNIIHVDVLPKNIPILVVPETSANVPVLDNNALTMLKHYETTSNLANVDCGVCSISFPDVEILRLHNELVHNSRSPKNAIAKYGCTICGKKFNTKGGLVIHQQVGHNCGELPQLSLKEQNEGTDSQFGCNLCSKVFKKENYLAQHLKTHYEKQWNCDDCGKSFATKYFLKKHKRLHTGEMPYTCFICEKHFTFQQSYNRHMSYHTNEKPHACKECGRTFKELSTLYNHQRIHTGEKPYSCGVCGKDFRQRVSYLIHSRIHTGLKPYVCSKCQKSFRYKVMLRNHKCTAQTEVTWDKLENHESESR